MTPSIVPSFLGIDRQRRPHLYAIVTKREALRHYANYFTWRIVEPDRRADCACGIIYGAVTKKSEACFAALRFLFGEGTPADGPDAEHVEEF